MTRPARITPAKITPAASTTDHVENAQSGRPLNPSRHDLSSKSRELPVDPENPCAQSAPAA
jgi:hypothetical protein